MSSSYNAIVMLAAGIGIPLLAALNAALGRELGSPAVASVILFAVALATAFAVSLVTGFEPLTRSAQAPKHLFLAGVLIAFYVLSITWIAPRFGIGNAVFFVLLGQLVSAAIIDHFALFGATQTPLNAFRAGGIALMAGGVFLTQIAGRV
ncbi:MAG: DMT family transporter [Pseudomonadota bacterium]